MNHVADFFDSRNAVVLDICILLLNPNQDSNLWIVSIFSLLPESFDYNVHMGERGMMFGRSCHYWRYSVEFTGSIDICQHLETVLKSFNALKLAGEGFAWRRGWHRKKIKGCSSCASGSLVSLFCYFALLVCFCGGGEKLVVS